MSASCKPRVQYVVVSLAHANQLPLPSIDVKTFQKKNLKTLKNVKNVARIKNV